MANLLSTYGCQFPIAVHSPMFTWIFAYERMSTLNAGAITFSNVVPYSHAISFQLFGSKESAIDKAYR